MMYHSLLQWVDTSIARIASVIFVFHPIHVENVASIVGRADCLCGLFFFASMILYTYSARLSATSISSIVAIGKHHFLRINSSLVLINPLCLLIF